jgi:glycosyltransferase involved in cell wall biosynthesis
MKVLIVTYLASTSPSGVVTAYKALTNDLTGEGVDVHIVDASSTPVLWRKFLGILKRIMRPLGGFASVLYDEFAYFTGVYLATRRLRKAGFDLIHAQDARSGAAAYRAMNKQVPVVLTCHFNGDPVTELVKGFLLKPWAANKLTAWYKYMLGSINNYIFPSNYVYTKSQHLLPATINKRVLYNTVTVKDMSGLEARKPSDQVLISNVGYIDERKNQKLLIQIGHQLRQRGIDNFNIWLIGEGPKRAEYEQLTKELGLQEHVTFYGQQTAPWRLVAQTDLYVHTALNENCPYSIVEAFAVKTPVLALPVGGIPEMLPEQFGLLRGTDLNRLTDEVASCFHPQKRLQLTKAQAIFAEQKFNHQTSLNQLLAFYQEISSQAQPLTATANVAEQPMPATLRPINQNI